MRVSYRQAIVAACVSLLWHLTHEEGDHIVEANLRNALREYIKRYEKD